MKRLIAAVVFATLAAPLSAADDPALLYKGKCAMCHGAKGEADTPMGKKLALKPLSSPEVQKLTDEQMKELIVKGKGKMPAFGSKLSADQVKQLIGIVRGFAKK